MKVVTSNKLYHHCPKINVPMENKLIKLKKA